MNSNKNFAIAIVTVLSLVLLAAVIWPLNEQRDKSVDRVIDADLSSISQSVDEYYSENGRLPDEIEDLELGDDTEARISKYSYSFDKDSSRSYKLCAVFKTDTTQSDDDGTDLPIYSSFYEAQRTHAAGLDCYDYEVYGYYDEPYRGGFEDLDFGSDEYLEGEIPGSFEYELEDTSTESFNL